MKTSATRVLAALIAAFVLVACGGGNAPDSNSSFSYHVNPALYARGVAIEANKPDVQGTLSGFKIEPVLPDGLTIDKKNGAIRGTPTVLAPLSVYTVIANSPNGKVMAPLALGVEPPSRFAVVGNAVDDTLSISTIDPLTAELRPCGYSVRTHGELGLHHVIAHPKGTPIYVLDTGSNDIALYDIAQSTGAIQERTTIPTDANPAAFVIDSTGSFAYVLCKDAATVQTYSVDATTGDLTASDVPLYVGGSPQTMALRADGRMLYVALSGFAQVQAFAIDPTTHALTSNGSSQPTGKAPVAMALDRTGRFLYTADLRAEGVTLFSLDATTGVPTFVANIPTGDFPADLGIDPTNRFLYVAVSGANSILPFAIDFDDGSVTSIGAPVGAGFRPVALAFDSTGTHLYDLDSNGNEVWSFTIDPQTGALSPARESRTRDIGVAIEILNGDTPATPRPRFAYVTNPGSSDISMYAADPDNGVLTSISASLFSSGSPKSIVAGTAGRFVYSLNTGADDVHVFSVDASSGALTESGVAVPVGTDPIAGAIEPSGRFLFVADQSSDDLTTLALDPLTGQPSFVATTPTNSSPSSAIVDPTGRFLFVASYSANTISTYRIDPFSGALTPTAFPLTVTGRPSALVCHPDGRMIYACFELGESAGSFDIDALSGVLSNPKVQSTGILPRSITIDPRGRFAYTANSNPSGIGDLSYYSVDPKSGDLLLLGSAPALLSPISVVGDPSGRFLYAVDSGDDSVSIYGLNQKTGKPTLGVSVATGVLPSAIALVSTLE